MYYKFLNKSCKHYGITYKMNIDIIDMFDFSNKHPYGRGCISYYTKEQLAGKIYSNSDAVGNNKLLKFWVCDVTVPKKQIIYKLKKEYKTKRIILSNKRKLWNDISICLYLVQLNGLLLEHVVNQTEKICLTAVTQNAYAIRYVKRQTEDI